MRGRELPFDWVGGLLIGLMVLEVAVFALASIMSTRVALCSNSPECRAERVYEQQVRWAEDDRRFAARMAELKRGGGS